jgi:rubrerythrin
MEQKAMDYNNSGFSEETYKTLEEALDLVSQAVQGERKDELFYDYLISVAPTQEEKEIISDIRDDERKHNRMFREIYEYYTGYELPQADREDFAEPASYLEGIKEALFGELAAMERYRIIHAGLPSRYYRDMVFEILTDELKHADKYNYILNLNSGDSKRVNSMQTTGQGRESEQEHRPNRDQNQDQEKNQMDEEQRMTLEQVLEYIDPIVNEAMKEAEAGTDLRRLFQKYIVIGILIGNGFSMEQGVEQVKVWEKGNYI